MSISRRIGTRASVKEAFSWILAGSESSKQSGKVRTFLFTTRFLLIGVAWGTASKCMLLGIGAKFAGFATFGLENPLPESLKEDVVMPLYLSSLPYSNSCTSLASNKLIDEAVTCWECPISSNFFLSSFVKVRLVNPGYLLYKAP